MPSTLKLMTHVESSCLFPLLLLYRTPENVLSDFFGNSLGKSIWGIFVNILQWHGTVYSDRPYPIEYKLAFARTINYLFHSISPQ